MAQVAPTASSLTISHLGTLIKEIFQPCGQPITWVVRLATKRVTGWGYGTSGVTRTVVMISVPIHLRRHPPAAVVRRAGLAADRPTWCRTTWIIPTMPA